MLRTAVLAGLTMLWAGGVGAQEATGEGEFALGQQEYLAACAACHGEAADGNGPIATMFRNPVPDLTGLAQRNGGEFPLIDVIHIIDGRAEVRAHGNPMPVFGRRFAAEIGDGLAPSPSEAMVLRQEELVRHRVLELALYLQSIQK